MLKWIKKKSLRFIADDRGASPIEIATVFAIAVVGATLVFSPMISSTGEQVALNRTGEIDRVVTGSINRSNTTRRYTMRRSVLQSTPNSRCIIFADGNTEGDC